ncbi:MAG TPA: isocitrate/isopropylmalate dehydrogenase family protein [Nitrososphaerales archaeon]|nr:isocitrate/isopropylmalate dehydrogenase family protein [Nitrososphaerales archaeon]
MPRAYRVSFIEGDGIGPEILSASRSVLETLSECFNLNFEFIATPAGDRALAKTGEALPRESFIAIKESDVCLKAPVGETAKETILKIRQDLDLYANIRPARNYVFVESRFKNVDLVIVRENTEDIYVGREFEEHDGKRATALKVTTEKASKRIAKVAFEMAASRQVNREREEKRDDSDSYYSQSARTDAYLISDEKRQQPEIPGRGVGRNFPSVTCVHKSNVLPKTDGLFVKSCTVVAEGYPSIKFSTMYVDTAAMSLVRNPESFDVIVTSNMYGDILSDEASQVVGGLGIAASANLGDGFALFEPVHGCAPDIAGKGIANPISMIFTAKMMLDWLGTKRSDENCLAASLAIDRAVSAVGARGVLTPDIGGASSTAEVTREICSEIREMYGEDGERVRGMTKKGSGMRAGRQGEESRPIGEVVGLENSNRKDVLLKKKW